MKSANYLKIVAFILLSILGCMHHSIAQKDSYQITRFISTENLSSLDSVLTNDSSLVIANFRRLDTTFRMELDKTFKERPCDSILDFKCKPEYIPFFSDSLQPLLEFQATNESDGFHVNLNVIQFRIAGYTIRGFDLDRENLILPLISIIEDFFVGEDVACILDYLRTCNSNQ